LCPFKTFTENHSHVFTHDSISNKQRSRHGKNVIKEKVTDVNYFNFHESLVMERKCLLQRQPHIAFVEIQITNNGLKR
jgi:hypothetical protein